ncbi:MAG: hypothetical protein NDI63_14705 [Pseudobdellovibrio sp.]|nr:hypothetical protein [Pseudobdellovibrio sp.]
MSQIFLSILGLALLTWVGKYLFVLYYYRRKKEEINRLEARTAVLRMLLKAKLKRKGSQMQDQYKDNKEFLALITSKLELLTTFNFNRSSDYDDVLNILTSISEAIDMQTVKDNPALYTTQHAHAAKAREDVLAVSVDQAVANASDNSNKYNDHRGELDRWSQLWKYDKGNMYIVKELVETTDELKTKVELYNIEQENKELKLLLPNLIVVDGFEGLRALVNRDQEKIKAGKEAKKQNSQDPELVEIEAVKKAKPSSGSGDQNAA